jgi:uroporphyrinogen-III synthase
MMALAHQLLLVLLLSCNPAVLALQVAPVALTRELGKNGKLAEALRGRGIPSVELPCIAHAEGADRRSLAPALKEEPGYGYVAITSPEAAKVFLEGWLAAGKPSVSVASVGEATAAALRSGGVDPVFTPSKANAETLAAELPMSSPPTVLYPASARAQKTLEEGLGKRGFLVRRLSTYDTVPAVWGGHEQEVASRTTVAAFGSPSAVKTWAERLGARSCLAACIGETSASACRRLGWEDSSIFYPESPGMEGWAAAVEAAIESLSGEAPSP